MAALVTATLGFAVLALLAVLRSVPAARLAAMCLVAGVSRDEAAEVRAVAAGLPEGSQVTRVALNAVPEGWFTEDGGGLLIEAEMSGAPLRVWLLARTWVGIRTEALPEPKRSTFVSKDRVAIVSMSDEASGPFVAALIVDNHFEGIDGNAKAFSRFQGREATAEATSARLLAAHCPDQASLDEAVNSLVWLAVPANHIFRRVALGGGPLENRVRVIEALARSPDTTAIETFDAVLKDPQTIEILLAYTSRSIEHLHEPSLGPALLSAFNRVRLDPYNARWLVEDLGDLRYAPAGPALLSAFLDVRKHDNTDDEIRYLNRLANALADVRYMPAVPALQAYVVGGLDDVMERAGLLRLTAPFGEPADGVRYFIEGPMDVSVGQPIKIRVWAEVVDERIKFPNADLMVGELVVDGASKKYGVRFLTQGNRGEVLRRLSSGEYDVADQCRTPGRHRLHFEHQGATSNAIDVVVH